MSVRLLIAAGMAAASLSVSLLTPASAFAQAPVDLSFPLDKDRREANFDAAAKEIAAADRNIAPMVNELRNALRGQDLLEPEMRRLGLTTTDLGDVLALAQFSAVMLADGGRTDDPTPAQLRGIRSVILNVGGAQLAGMSASDKQDAADQMLFLVIVQQTVADALQGQPALDNWMRAFAASNSQMLGFDVTQVKMGPNGFATTAQPAPQDSTASLAAGPARDSSAASAQAGTLGTGVADILGVDWENSMIFVPGFNGGSLQQINTIYVLMKDGRACQDCLSDVLEGNYAAVRARDSRDIGRWRKAGAKYLITFDDGDTHEVEAARLVGPAPGGKTFNTNFKGVSGTSVGIANTLSIDYLNFRSDGTFSADGGTSSVGAYAIASVERATQTGRYIIDGYRIVFEYNNGAREEASFVLWDADPKEPVIIIDEVPHFVPDD